MVRCYCCERVAGREAACGHAVCVRHVGDLRMVGPDRDLGGLMIVRIADVCALCVLELQAEVAAAMCWSVGVQACSHLELLERGAKG